MFSSLALVSSSQPSAHGCIRGRRPREGRRCPGPQLGWRNHGPGRFLDRLSSPPGEPGGDAVILLATALRISEVAGLRVGDVDLDYGLLQVARQTYPGRGELVTKETKGRRRGEPAHLAAGRRAPGSGGHRPVPPPGCAGDDERRDRVFDLVVRSWSGAVEASGHRRGASAS